MAESAMPNADPLSASASGQFSGGEFRIDDDDDDDDPLSQPPAYEDVVGDTPENGTQRRGESAASSSSSAILKDTLEIRVRNPQKEVDPNGSLVPGGGTFVTYEIQTKTSLPHFSAPHLAVRRRFRDFVTLADRLAEKYRGYFIPTRPDKSVVESQVMHAREFVEQRRLALEKYLRRLAAHPFVRRSDELRIFLEAEGRLPLMPSTDVASRMLDGAAKLPRQLFGADSSLLVPTPQEAAKPAAGGRDLMRMFRELRQSVTNDWTTRPIATEEDKEFVEKKDKLLDLEKHLTEASAKAEQLVKAQQDLGDMKGEMGLSFIKLSNFEEATMITSDAQRQHAADARRFGNGSVVLSRHWRAAVGHTSKHLSQLHDYLEIMQAVHAAVSDRQQALVTVQTLTADLAAKREKLVKLEAASKRVLGGDQARTRKMGELEKEIATTEAAKEVAESEYEKIQERNREELDRIEVERKRDFHSMLEGFVRTQVDIAEKTAKAWATVAEEFSKAESVRKGSTKATSSSSPSV